MKSSDLANVGKSYWGGVENITTIANEWKKGANGITLPAGKYIVVAHVVIPANAGRGNIQVAEAEQVENMVSFVDSTLPMRQNLVFAYGATAQKTLYLQLWTEKSITAGSCEIMALQIK